MKSSIYLILSFLLLTSLLSCKKDSPSEYFRICIAETNRFSHFGAEELRDIFSMPPLQYNTKTKQMDSVGYQAVIQEKINFNQKQLDEVQKLKINNDNSQIVNGAKDLYQYVLQKQRGDYLRFAKMKDNGSSNEQINSLLRRFDSTNKKVFEDKLNLLWGYGTQYANRHSINLNRQPNQQ